MTDHAKSPMYVYGVIPLKEIEGVWYTYLVHRNKGFWEFPKGHSEGNEKPIDTAKRELFEETGLQVKRIISDTPLEIHYRYTEGNAKIEKFAVYFLAEVEGTEALQVEEVLEGEWLTIGNAEAVLTFKNSKALCRDVQNLLLKIK